MSIAPRFSGVFTALVTPFLEGELDLASFKKLVAFQLNGEIDGFVINGTTGESPTLSREEVRRLYEAARESSPESFPIILGTGSNCTQKTIEMTQIAQEWGADGALVVVPYYNKPTQKGLENHFKSVAKSVDIPIVLYNVPGRTITSLNVETIAELSTVKNIIGIKEATGDIAFGEKIRSQTYSEFLITSGDDQTCAELAGVGGNGVISVISHLIPKQLKEIMNSSREGLQANSNYLEKYGPLLEAVYAESNPIGIKQALFLMKIIDTPELRPPLTSMTKLATAQLEKELKNLELLP